MKNYKEETETCLEHSTHFFFHQPFPDAVLSLLNIPIYMQVSEQLDVSLLSFWFLFRKQHVRDDGGDVEQSYFIIKFTSLLEHIAYIRVSANASFH